MPPEKPYVVQQTIMGDKVGNICHAGCSCCTLAVTRGGGGGGMLIYIKLAYGETTSAHESTQIF